MRGEHPEVHVDVGVEVAPEGLLHAEVEEELALRGHLSAFPPKSDPSKTRRWHEYASVAPVGWGGGGDARGLNYVVHAMSEGPDGTTEVTRVKGHQYGSPWRGPPFAEIMVSNIEHRCM